MPTAACLLLLIVSDTRGVPLAPAPPPLSPGEVLVVCNPAVDASRALADYYADRRGIPSGNVVAIPVPNRETITRAEYDAFAGALRREMRDRGLIECARAIVTVYGLPIRVDRCKPTPAQAELARALEKELYAVIQELDAKVSRLEALVDPVVGPPAPATQPAPDTTVDLRVLADRYAKAKTLAVLALREATTEADRSALMQDFILILEDVEGPAGIIARLNADPESANPYAVARLDELRDELDDAEQRINALLAAPIESPLRAEARRLIRRYQGLRGAADILREDRNHLLGRETGAALDSELALLEWTGYPLYRWQMNLLAWRVRTNEALRDAIPETQWRRPVLMTARLDGPSPAVVRRMIDDAIATERRGLTGRVYIDARGLPDDDPHAPYDRNLLALADLLRRHTTLRTVLDQNEAVFAPGCCPDAALYCGWYSLRHYVPAFAFTPGAVGYHIASAEAFSLHDPDETGWCKRLLDEGCAATIGPVDEPYLAGYPLPRDFFGLLLTGRFTLAECFAYTNQFNSWQTMLIGDPLYRPFRTDPALELDDVITEDFRPSLISLAPASQSADQ
jgi:uncharacterized protein (TIGR03790 family)